MAFTVLFVLAILFTACSAAHNITIENDTGDAVTGLLPIYQPTTMWSPQGFTPRQGDTNPYNVTTAVAVTSTVFASPTGEAWMSLLFQGIAIYVTFVLTSGAAQLNFVMDGEPLQYEFSYQQNTDYDFYNATVYSNSSLASTGTGLGGFHNLTIFSGVPMSFDFAEYTVLDADDIPPNTPNTLAATPSSIVGVSPSGSAVTQTPILNPHSALSGGAIAGISVGAVLGVAALVIILYRVTRNSDRHRWRSAKSEIDLCESKTYEPRPFPLPTIRSIEQMSLVPTSRPPPSFTDYRRSFVSSIPANPFHVGQHRRPSFSEKHSAGAMSPSAHAIGFPVTRTHTTLTALVEEINALRAQLARLKAHTSTLELQAKLTLLEAQLYSDVVKGESPQIHQHDSAAPVPE